MARQARVAAKRPRVAEKRAHAAPAALRAPLLRFVWVAAAVVLSATFLYVALRVLATLPHDFDEAWLMLDARFILRGLRPFVDFAHHEMPLHPYLLALSGKLFGQSVSGFRALSVASIALTGFLLFCLTRPAFGAVPALGAQALFTFSPIHARTVCAVPETSMVLFTLLGAVCVFLGRQRWSAYAGGIAFALALLVKPTCLAVVIAVVASLAHARSWARLRAFAVATVVAGLAGLSWVLLVSD